MSFSLISKRETSTDRYYKSIGFARKRKIMKDKMLSAALCLVLGIAFAGCSVTKVSPKNAGEEHFKLENNWRSKVFEAVLRDFSKSQQHPYKVSFSNPYTSDPIEECIDLTLFGLSCKYYGNVSFVYDVPALRKYGTRPKKVMYDYEIRKGGRPSVTKIKTAK